MFLYLQSFCLHSLSRLLLQAKVSIAEQTEKDIDATRLEYVPVAVRTQILFFCVSDLSNVDPMYQYSLEWFLNIFLAGIGNSERAGTTVRSPGGAYTCLDIRSPLFCVFQTRWSRGLKTSTSISPLACTATCAAACLRSISSCSPSCCALAS